MKSYSSKRRENSRHNSKRKHLFQVLGIGVLVVLLLWLIGGAVGTLTSYITKPVYLARTWLSESTGTIPEYFRDRNSLIHTIDSLQEQVASEKTNDQLIAHLQLENDELRALVGNTPSEHIAAGVIAKPPFLPYDTFLIDRGSLQGIQKNAIVYRDTSYAIGFVSKTFPTSALVTLFSTPGVTATGYIRGPDIYTTIHGMGGGILSVRVPQGIALASGDVVILPFLESGLIGKIHSVESDPTEPAQTGFIVGDQSTQSIRIVSVSTHVHEAVDFETAQTFVEQYDAERFEIDVPPEMMIDTASSTATTTQLLEVEPEEL